MIKNLLKKDLILVKIDENIKTKFDAISFISQKCSSYITDIEALKDAFISREEISSTGFGGGVAIPHAKLANFTSPLVGIFKFKDGVDWDSIDEEPVKVAIALVMPEGDDTHLSVLAKFSRKLMNEYFTNYIFNEDDVENLYNFITKEME